MLALGALLAAVAGAVTPPSGTPDLATMSVQLSDLQPGASIASDGYTKPGKGFTAKYLRQITGAKTTASGQAVELVVELDLAPTTGLASKTEAGEHIIFSSKLGHSLLGAEIIKAAGASAHVVPKDLHFSKIERIATLPGAFLEALAVRTKQRLVTADFIGVRVGRVVATLTVLGLGFTVDRSIGTALAATVAAHISAVLGKTGSTGPSGATGATGAT